jgi:hypothetical protein
MVYIWGVILHEREHRCLRVNARFVRVNVRVRACTHLAAPFDNAKGFRSMTSPFENTQEHAVSLEHTPWVTTVFTSSPAITHNNAKEDDVTLRTANEDDVTLRAGHLPIIIPLSPGTATFIQSQWMATIIPTTPRQNKTYCYAHIHDTPVTGVEIRILVTPINCNQVSRRHVLSV